MADPEARQETGASLMFIGLAIWVADLLVVFFLPAGIRLGSRATFFSIIVVLAVLGLTLMLTGYFQRVFRRIVVERIGENSNRKLRTDNRELNSCLTQSWS